MNIKMRTSPYHLTSTSLWPVSPPVGLLRLYEALELLGERVLYFDTDSVIYLEQEGQPNPVLGDYLGEFTSELDPDDYIEEFVSG